MLYMYYIGGPNDDYRLVKSFRNETQQSICAVEDQ